MCGIAAYVGHREAYPIILNGLKRLEYRGYDSAGIALLNGNIEVHKCKGKVKELLTFVQDKNTIGSIGMGHTRWATHGAPNDINAHPHLSETKNLAIIHNGIIENYKPLKEELTKRGYTFQSDTDTEVLVNLIEDIAQNENVALEKAVRLALNQVTGAYAIVVLSKNEPNQLIGARKGSPLVIGIGDKEFFLASDATPIVEHTKNVVYLNDEEIVTINKNGAFTIKTIGDEVKTPYIQELEWHLEMLEKGGYKHFMLKEIYEQPASVKDSTRGRLHAHGDKGMISLGGISNYQQKLINANRIIIVGCGTSWHAGLVGEYLIEDLARISVEVEYASEFRYRNPIISEEDIVVAISQSGETADTLAAIQLAKSKGATILGVCNVVGSSIARASDAGVYTHAGPEIGVASTKAYTSQVTVLTLIALMIAHAKGTITTSRYFRVLNELELIPSKIQKVLDGCKDQIDYISSVFCEARNFLYLGRGYNFPVALEGALKLKEISYIHAEGYPAAEMKHGPIALIDDEMPVVVLATNMSAREKIVSNIQEVIARKGRVIGIVTEGDNLIEEMAEFVIEIPDTAEPLTPLLSVVPLQLLSYKIAVLRGCNVDQPRNLAKSVTVE